MDVAERPGSGRPGLRCTFANRNAIPVLPAAGWLGVPVSIIGLLRQWWTTPEPRPVVKVNHLDSVDEKRVTGLVRKIIETNSPRVLPDRSLADDVTCARRGAPTNGTPQPRMSKPVICGLERDFLHYYAQR